MSHELIIHTAKSANDLEQLGRQIYKENPILKDVAMVMEHPEFRNIYNNYFNNFEDLKTFVALTKTYEFIDKNSDPDQTNSFQKLAMLKKIIIEQPDFRHQIGNSVNNWMSNKRALDNIK